MVDWQTDMAKKIGKIFTYSNERAKINVEDKFLWRNRVVAEQF